MYTSHERIGDLTLSTRNMSFVSDHFGDSKNLFPTTEFWADVSQGFTDSQRMRFPLALHAHSLASTLNYVLHVLAAN